MNCILSFSWEEWPINSKVCTTLTLDKLLHVFFCMFMFVGWNTYISVFQADPKTDVDDAQSYNRAEWRRLSKFQLFCMQVIHYKTDWRRREQWSYGTHFTKLVDSRMIWHIALRLCLCVYHLSSIPLRELFFPTATTAKTHIRSSRWLNWSNLQSRGCSGLQVTRWASTMTPEDGSWHLWAE